MRSELEYTCKLQRRQNNTHTQHTEENLKNDQTIIATTINDLPAELLRKNLQWWNRAFQ